MLNYRLIKHDARLEIGSKEIGDPDPNMRGEPRRELRVYYPENQLGGQAKCLVQQATYACPTRSSWGGASFLLVQIGLLPGK